MSADVGSLGTDMIREMNVGTNKVFDTRTHLQNAQRQAIERGLNDLLIVDADSHHNEHEWLRDVFEYVEDPVLRHTFGSVPGTKGSSLLFSSPRNQFNAGRLTRYGSDETEVSESNVHSEVLRARRQRESIGLNYQIIFPTPMLELGLHPDPRIESALSWAYTRWWTEEVLTNDAQMHTMVYLPLRDVDQCLRMIDTFAGRQGVAGFMITSSRFASVHENQYMPIYAALEERGLPLGFHAGFNQQERVLEGMNRFLSVHAIGFVLNNLVHMTNLVINGIPERFPRLKFVMIESGLAWIPFLMQRLDNEYLMRTNEAPLLTKLPSEYMAENFFYTTQPMETSNMEALELTMKMIRADTQLMFASDYPHWDFNLPSTVYDLPFLSQDQKMSILGRNALSVFPSIADEHAKNQSTIA